ncbi:hypothetical protein A0H76_507 [Hepatospora eriocheir]|uniref:Spindle assembly checkpoint component MAD1 n=1 Tax=Hepatospora eriocheir TaxID=1081669 RepID=A0A1X0QL51_9MICR|nr:hypothetical protein A0H76_507 [Hepatospora eriocheir]
MKEINTTLENVLGETKKETTINNKRRVLQPKFVKKTEEREDNLKDKHCLNKNIESILSTLKSINGYSIKKEGNILTFRSVYAFKKEDIFQFQITDNDKISIIQTKFLKEWEHLIEKYLIKKKSIPGFLSAITLELMERNTFE